MTCYTFFNARAHRLILVSIPIAGISISILKGSLRFLQEHFGGGRSLLQARR
jgi:hypothetical protein